VAVATVCGLLFGVGLLGPAFGQTSSPPRFTKVNAPIPDTQAWFFFLLSVNHNDRAAVKWTLKGNDGSWLRNYHQSHLGFTDEQFEPIRASAHRLDAEFKEITARMNTIQVEAAQTRIAGQFATVPSEWAALNAQRKTVVENEISNLKEMVGPEVTGTLQRYIRTHIAPNVTAYHKSPTQEVLP